MSTLKLAPQVSEAALARQWPQEARRTDRTDTYAGQRRYRRTTWEAALEVQVSLGPGRTETRYASARDISAGGIGFRRRQRIPPCAAVRVCLAGQAEGVRAMIMHCTQSLGGYLIGAEFRFEEQVQAEPAFAQAGWHPVPCPLL